VQFILNGEPVEVELTPETKLIYVLRNDLKLKGTRFGCGTGNCGSCTVLIDDQPVQSCDIALWSLQGKRVTTIEGLGTADVPHPIQSIFIDEQAAQCGYCINGMMMTLEGLLKKTSNPSDAELLAALDRHLCRCGTHMRILNAARRAIATIQGAAA
jgi:nicotinate dehydrogenase subunit A